MVRTIRFLSRNGMLNARYARLLWRYLWRRFLTPAGWRWETDGPVFFGRNLQLQIKRGATIRFGRGWSFLPTFDGHAFHPMLSYQWDRYTLTGIMVRGREAFQRQTSPFSSPCTWPSS